MHRRVFAFLLLGACNSPARPAVDAGWDGSFRDTRLPGDTAPPTATVDFTVANCPSTDVQKGTCTGTAPFTVQFVPVASAGITQFLWDFGDGSSGDLGQAPWHTFDSPGTFDIKLGGVGSTVLVWKTREAFIEVLPSRVGSPCLRDQQCASGTCLCSTVKPCGYGPVNGLCSSLCQKASCSEGQVCVNLVTATSSTRAEPWQTQVCLPDCESDLDCPGGLVCRSLPAWPNAATKVKGCFVDAPAELGRSCVDSVNGLRNDLCLSGLCADLGALGLCSRDCTSDSCPAGSECALFGDGRQLCLVPCSPTFLCEADPLLSCVTAGPSQLGFRILSPSNSGAVYCAPKPCAANTDCGASGICLQASGGGHCVSRYR
jgi:PKD repeat protein